MFVASPKPHLLSTLDEWIAPGTIVPPPKSGVFCPSLLQSPGTSPSWCKHAGRKCRGDSAGGDNYQTVRKGSWWIKALVCHHSSGWFWEYFYMLLKKSGRIKCPFLTAMLNNTFLYCLSSFPVLLSLFPHSSSSDHFQVNYWHGGPTLKILFLGETKPNWWDQRKAEGKKVMNKLLDVYSFIGGTQFTRKNSFDPDSWLWEFLVWKKWIPVNWSLCQPGADITLPSNNF